MTESYRLTKVFLFSLIFLLPIFFLPGSALSLSAGKSLLLAVASTLVVLAFLYETWRNGRVELPWHLLIVFILALPAIYILSALINSPSTHSLFGYDFEIGTSGFILAATAILIIGGIILKDSNRALRATITIFGSLLLIIAFASIKILTGMLPIGTWPVWGIFPNTSDSPIGRWTDLAVISGFVSLLSIFALRMLPMKKLPRVLLYAVFAISTLLLVVLNFSVAFVLVLVAAVFGFLYFKLIEMKSIPVVSGESNEVRPTTSKVHFLLIALAVLSVFFIVNPKVSETRGRAGDVVSNFFGVANTEVRPSLSATLDVSREVLSSGILLGSGPNTFGREWLANKPLEVNATPFWGIAFPFGVGFIPTQIAATGVLGTALWLALLVLIIIMGIKSLLRLPESRSQRFVLVTILMALIYFWLAAIIYAPSVPVLILAFLFTGTFIAVSTASGVISLRSFDFNKDNLNKYVSRTLLVVLALVTLTFGYVAVNKTLSAFYFQRAINLSNAGGSFEDIEKKLVKAASFSPTDLHYTALSRVNFAQAQSALSSTQGSSEELQEIFRNSLEQSISYAREAISANPEGYNNWIAMGVVYSALVPAPFSVEGAYENAKLAFEEALKRHPSNPEVPLFLAQLELRRGSVEAARSYIRASLAQKEDYADAYLMLVEIAVQENNIREAIASAERASALLPGNAGVHFELGLLKYSQRDFRGAAEALVRALTVAPDYANAQYYLGLALINLGQLEDARTLFEALNASNPESAEVRTILESLRQGRRPTL